MSRVRLQTRDTQALAIEPILAHRLLSLWMDFHRLQQLQSQLLLKRKFKLNKLSSPSPESKVPKSRPKGLGLTLKSHGPPTCPTAPPSYPTAHCSFHPPITFKQEECSGKKVLIVKVDQNDLLDSSSQKIDRVDSKIKDVG